MTTSSQMRKSRTMTARQVHQIVRTKGGKHEDILMGKSVMKLHLL
jgi:hypothetical protein